MHLMTDTSAQSHFANVPTISRSRNGFSIAKKHVTTIQFDSLFPMYTKFIYPGDTLSVAFKALARLQTQTTVLYDDLYFDAHAWFVPFRLLQTNWARYQFNSQPAGPSQDNTSLTSPAIDLTGMTTGFASKSLYDYFGYPTLINQAASAQHMNNYLARAYNFIWNTNYRDENLQTAAVVDLDDGPDSPSDYILRKRGKRHDKFTSMLTAAQKGIAPSIPLGTSAPVTITTPSTNPAIQFSGGGPTTSAWTTTLNIGAPTAGTPVTWTGNTPGVAGAITSRLNPSLVFAGTADLANAIGTSLNAFRLSVGVQHLMEADARGGTRDVESIQHRWGVTVPDFRLQRPEYLGGQTFMFDGHVVPQTSETGTTPQGNLATFSQSMSSMNITHSFVEHGVFMILLSARSNMTYQQGLKRELSYRTRFDWYQPEFSNLGEVAVLSKEIYFDGVAANDNATAGFQEYAYELRYDDNIVTAEMRSNYPQSLDSKHMAYDFATRPTLSAGFIESFTPISRNIVVSSDIADPIELNTLTLGRIARTLPMYSIPGLNRL